MSPLERALPPAPAVREMDARVEVPADEKDPSPRFQHRFLHVCEVISSINDDTDALGLRITPDTRLDPLQVGRLHNFSR